MGLPYRLRSNGAIVAGAIVALVTLVGGQIAVAVVRSSLIRAAIVLLFAVPAAIAAYHATLGLAQIGVPAQGWQEAFALIGATIVGGAAWTRLTPSAPPGGGQALRRVRLSCPPVSAIIDQ